ncbi:alpha/beta fold hydrolase [Vibrio sonorensis]|uniref:alpha/beta fold hydrolase n=1 Tax=Vibrio sonorensis TaxID=1004316 RepID=UPI0008DB2B6A|nr:alpha/beta hydrolase [Vibrio sonorensis]
MDHILQREFKFEGHTIKYDVKGQGEPLVLVHGTPWSSYNLRHLIKGLSQRFKVYYFDLLGYGQSDKPDADVSLGVQNRLLDALIREWGIEKPYVVGHDFGGTTVLRCHLLNKQRFKKMVVIDPVVFSPWGSPFFKHVNQYEQAFAGVPDYIHKAIVEAYIKTAAYQELSEETLLQTIGFWTRDKGKAGFYRQIAQADMAFTQEIEEKLAEVDTPTLVMWGEEDTWIPVEQAYRLANAIPQAQLSTIKNAGHLVIEEEPETLIQSISTFLN